MTFPTPPRGSGRHWRDDAEQRLLHTRDMPTDPSMPAPLNRAPQRPVRPGREARYQDLVVPRVFVEPDEYMDGLRRRSLWWAIVRDIIVCAVGLWLIGSWALPPIMRVLGFIP
jgi:hypothetical protein